MLLGGDFRQMLPVIEKGSRYDVVQACLKTSSVWPLFKANDHEYREWLMKIGNGEALSDENSDIQVPPPLICSGNIADAIFGDAFSGRNMDLSELAILTPRNVDALRINDYVLDRLSGEKSTFLSEDEAIVENPSDALNFPTEFLNEMTPTGMPPHALHLKVGCIMMLLRNIDVRNGLCNGTRLIVKQIGRRLLVCEHAVGIRKGSQAKAIPYQIKLCHDINKSQGQSFFKVGIALHDPIFAHGQLYVALSRTRSSDGVIIEAPKNLMRNIVYNESLVGLPKEAVYHSRDLVDFGEAPTMEEVVDRVKQMAVRWRNVRGVWW
ncbi:unnamed protein product [Heligmosomoides polygyrus]|uniref:ATP-dependent DNA helicase n=1 Tax=Heligmosomoides polygyrus TaxID=6339 RepID=A0A183GS92_HELPZ|nr:unnamed protein product [Heligmosomoides polygyrus]